MLLHSLPMRNTEYTEYALEGPMILAPHFFCQNSMLVKDTRDKNKDEPSWPYTCGILVNALRDLVLCSNFQDSLWGSPIACAKCLVIFGPQGRGIWDFEGSLIVRICGWDTEILVWDTDIFFYNDGIMPSLELVDQTSQKFLHMLWLTSISSPEGFTGNRLV